ncbi:HAD family hydrolase [Brumicola nitratireducens]|uniref:Haloacid dehalogenase-like hydrolase n=1 Tax=Glaciecola nitratireducens (strain JCM 12485 / KCTC 12276 / FR1064) TaxID=1085623 RepID=G4QJH8_GLANF|nr:HAD family hydrolase [Glaciecola nitratireducens]AEP28584.1 haloacid dehalogenase-like hydrolase [Glaciecola nitratireducens FR1064]
MDLIFFDLDGTLLNDESKISTFTKDTLVLLREKNIAYTVATGRTMLSAKSIVDGHYFDLPQIYNNGVTVWDPKIQQLSLENLLDNAEISAIINSSLSHGITPFVNAIGNYKQQNHHHIIYHAETLHEVEKELVNKYFSRTDAKLLPLHALPSDSQVTNISMIGLADTIHEMWLELNTYENLIAYSGKALEGERYSWMDVHHCRASKGNAVTNLKQQLGASNIICFGDGDNDLSMFALADESYAPDNAKAEIKKSATATIGHNHKDGIAHFLRERFSL